MEGEGYVMGTDVAWGCEGDGGGGGSGGGC